MDSTYLLLGLLNLLLTAIFHLTIPIFFAIRKITFSKKSLIGVAFISASVGFLICVLISQANLSPEGITRSAFWGMVSYFAILRKNCSEKTKKEEEEEDD